MEPESTVKRLYKSRSDRMIDGVCGGVAEYIGVDTTLVRLGFVLLVFAGGMGVVLYILGMILMPAGSMPATPAGESPKPKRSADSTARFIGIGFVVLGGLLLLGNFGLSFWDHWWGFSWSMLGPILLIAAGAALILRSPVTGAAGAATGQEGQGATSLGTSGATSPGARLYRSRLDRKFLGICGGLGVYLSVDPTILRLLLVISAIASFGGTILVYLITAIIVPTEPLEVRPA